MARRPKLISFLRIPWRLRRMALEAGWELFRARLLTLRPASVYTKQLGEAAEGHKPSSVAPEDEIAAAQIGAVVARAAAWMPFRALCLQQAIATRRMLTRRNLPATVFLGLARDPSERATADERAHAWVQTGRLVVNGDRDLDRFAVVGTFA